MTEFEEHTLSAMADDDQSSHPPAVTPRRRGNSQQEGSGLSFKARRTIVAERLAVDIVASKIDNHIISCEGFRKLLLAAVGVMISIIMVPLGFMLSEIYQIKGRQEVVLSRLAGIDQTLAADRDAVGQRISAVVTANGQRENTFNERFAALQRALESLQSEFHRHQLKMDSEYDQSVGPTRRR